MLKPVFRKIALLALVAGPTTLLPGITCGQESDFVVRDRLAEAWQRIGEPTLIAANPEAGESGVETAAIVSVVAKPNAATIHGDSHFVTTGFGELSCQEPTSLAQTPQPMFESESGGNSPTVLLTQDGRSDNEQQETHWVGTPVSTQHVVGGWAPSFYQDGSGYGLEQVGEHVFSNTHLFDGPKGYGFVQPFAYSSAMNRSGYGPTNDARGNPTQCDEWRSACGCHCCDEPAGLDMFKHRSWGTKRGSKGCGECGKSGCRNCDNTCNGPGGCNSCGTGTSRQGLFGHKRNIVDVIDN